MVAVHRNRDFLYGELTKQWVVDTQSERSLGHWERDESLPLSRKLSNPTAESVHTARRGGKPEPPVCPLVKALSHDRQTPTVCRYHSDLLCG